MKHKYRRIVKEQKPSAYQLRSTSDRSSNLSVKEYDLKSAGDWDEDRLENLLAHIMRSIGQDSFNRILVSARINAGQYSEIHHDIIR